MKTSTITAIATAMSNSGIGIVRISGSEAFTIIDRIYRSKGGKKKLSQVKSHTVHYGFIFDEDKMIDEVLVTIFQGPHSYTAEDTVEINCHGGALVMRRILETVIKHGARLAEPGEFTKRAFLNGRIDLSQAESVMDVIQATNDLALESSIHQLQGAVRDRIKEIREKVIHEIAFIESALDDPEHISLEGYGERLLEIVEEVGGELDTLVKSSENGELLKEGIHTVIVGKPNAGKSSLLNLLVGRERAIVTEIAGTTRDVIEEQIQLGGIPLCVVDTAGIRDTSDVVEKIGVDKAKEYLYNADLIIYVVDSTCQLDGNDDDIMKMIHGRKVIVLWNKSDLEPVVKLEELENRLKAVGEANASTMIDQTKDMEAPSGMDSDSCTNGVIKKIHKIIPVSAKEGTGLAELEDTIRQMFFHGDILYNNEVVITNVRQKYALMEASRSIAMVKESIMVGMPEDFYSIDLMNAYEELGSIIGEAVGEDLVNEIFSKFCMGK